MIVKTISRLLVVAITAGLVLAPASSLADTKRFRAAGQPGSFRWEPTVRRIFKRLEEPYRDLAHGHGLRRTLEQEHAAQPGREDGQALPEGRRLQVPLHDQRGHAGRAFEASGRPMLGDVRQGEGAQVSSSSPAF